jgi:hypothetical protein
MYSLLSYKNLLRGCVKVYIQVKIVVDHFIAQVLKKVFRAEFDIVFGTVNGNFSGGI